MSSMHVWHAQIWTWSRFAETWNADISFRWLLLYFSAITSTINLRHTPSKLGLLRNKSMIFMVFSKWSLALLWPEEAVYLLFNFPLDQSVCWSNNLLQSINILLLAVSRSLLPGKIIQGFCVPLIGRHTALPHTHPLPGPMLLSHPGTVSWSVPNTLRKWDADSFHFGESQKALLFFSLVAEWIVHWTVRGTSWTSAAVLTLHQWGAVHFSPHRSQDRRRDTVGGGRSKLPPTSFLTLCMTLASYHTGALLNIPQQKWAFNITDTANLLRNMEKWDLAACYEERLRSKYAPNGCRLSFLIPKNAI